MSIQLNVELQEVQAVLNALAKLPFEQVADLWFKIKSQAEQQIAAKQQNPVEPVDQSATEPAAEGQSA